LCKEDDFILMGCDGVWERYERNGQAAEDKGEGAVAGFAGDA
jgi:serine/threonine protein phosphatase PrpC